MRVEIDLKKIDPSDLENLLPSLKPRTAQQLLARMVRKNPYHNMHVIYRQPLEISSNLIVALLENGKLLPDTLVVARLHGTPNKRLLDYFWKKGNPSMHLYALDHEGYGPATEDDIVLLLKERRFMEAIRHTCSRPEQLCKTLDLIRQGSRTSNPSFYLRGLSQPELHTVARTLLRHKEARWRRIGLNLLAQPWTETVERLVRKLLNDPTKSVRAAALAQYLAYGNRLPDKLLPSLEQEDNSAILQYTQRTGDERTIPYLFNTLSPEHMRPLGTLASRMDLSAQDGAPLVGKLVSLGLKYYYARGMAALLARTDNGLPLACAIAQLPQSPYNDVLNDPDKAVGTAPVLRDCLPAEHWGLV